MLESNISCIFTLSKIWYQKNMGKYKGILKTAITFIVFWIIFEWKDGFVIGFLSQWIRPTYSHIKTFGLSCKKFLLALWDSVVMLSPFGRDMAQNPEFRYCLIIGTICVVLAFVFYLYALKDEFNWFSSLLLSPIAAISMWYLFYAFCDVMNIYKISVCFHLFALLASVLLSLFCFFIVLGVMLVFIS